MNQLVVLAGGLGTRLAQTLGDKPKPLALVAGMPVLEHQLELGGRHGFTDVRLLIHHRADAIREYFRDGRRWGVSVSYHVEREPLGTAGAVLDALPGLAERFIVLYGDTLLDVDLDRFWRRHIEAGADASLFVHPNDHPHDSDLVEIDEAGAIRAFHSHPRSEGRYLRNLVNAGLYVVEKRALARWSPPSKKQDFAHDLFPRMLAEGARLYGYRSREYIKDMGTPERLARVEADCRSGLVERLALRNPCTAVFLDRDGTLNVDVGHVRSVDQLALIEGAGPAVRRLNREGLLAVVVTNQPVVARGDCTDAELRRIHDKLETLLGMQGAYLDGLYYCPHHPDRGFPGERAELKVSCKCRKPGTALIEKAAADLGIRLDGSWMIGDRTADIKAAQDAGLRAVLVRSGQAGQDRKWPVRPDYEFFDLAEAVDFIIGRYSSMLERARALLPPYDRGSLVAIGGLGRSGKSTWASVFRDVLAERGQRAIVIALDSWLKSARDRDPGHVLGRFDVDAIEQTVECLAGRSGDVDLGLARYDRLSRERCEGEDVVTVRPGDIVLFEGVPALMIEPLRRAAAGRFYVECSEPMRRARFRREYRLRGARDEEIEALYQEREVDEHPFIKASAGHADAVIGE